MICGTRSGGGQQEVNSGRGIEAFYMGLVFGVVRPYRRFSLFICTPNKHIFEGGVSIAFAILE